MLAFPKALQIFRYQLDSVCNDKKCKKNKAIVNLSTVTNQKNFKFLVASTVTPTK